MNAPPVMVELADASELAEALVNLELPGAADVGARVAALPKTSRGLAERYSAYYDDVVYTGLSWAVCLTEEWVSGATADAYVHAGIVAVIKEAGIPISDGLVEHVLFHAESIMQVDDVCPAYESNADYVHALFRASERLRGRGHGQV